MNVTRHITKSIITETKRQYANISETGSQNIEKKWQNIAASINRIIKRKCQTYRREVCISAKVETEQLG